MAVKDNVAELIRAGDEIALASRAKEQPEQFDDKHWFAAVRTGKLGICRALVAAGLTPMRTRFDRAPLHFAASSHKEEIIQWLLELGADPNLQDSDGYKPLDLAFEFHESEPSPELVETLAKAGTEITVWTSVRMGDLNRCKALIEKSPYLLQAFSDEIALTPLMVAARMNRLEMAQFLIASGADVNAVSTKQGDGMGGNAPLWYAAQGSRTGREPIVELLLRNGAQVDFAGELGWTALHMAAQWNHPNVARILIENGAEIERLDDEGSPPMKIAQKHDSRDMMGLLSKLS